MRDDRRLIGLAAVWGVPAALALLSLLGLLAALFGQGGPWWPISWTALAVPLIVIVRCALRDAKTLRRGNRIRSGILR